MKVLFLTLANINSLKGSGIYIDLMNQFVNSGHQVYIVSPVERRHMKQTHVIREEQAVFLKVRTGNITKSKFIEKGLATLAIEGQYKRGIARHFKDVQFDLVLYSTPPITLTRVIEYIKNRDGAHTYLLLKDIFPQNSVDLEMIPANGLLHKFFRRKEIDLYNMSDYIGCMSQANVDYVLRHNPSLDATRVEVCPNSIKPMKAEKNLDKEKDMRLKYGIPLDKTIFVYGGNLGKPQGIDFLMQCLQANEESEQAFFLIIGSGTEFNRLQTFVSNANLKNTKILRELPQKDYDLLVTSCDVGLIFLDPRFTIPNFPSRLLSYMQASIPVLAFTDKSTDLGQVVEGGQFGMWAESGDLAAFRNHTALLCSDAQLREKMGLNAREYLESHYTVKQAYDIIMKHFV